MRILHNFNIFSSVPPDSSITYTALSKSVSLDVSILRRLIRHAMTLGYFNDHNGEVSHSSSSALLLRRPSKLPVLAFMSTIGYKSMTGMLEALMQWPGSQDPAHTGFSAAYGVGGQEGMFEYLERDREMSDIYVGAMAALADSPGMGKSFIVEGFDWETLGSGATVVDVSAPRADWTRN